MMIDMISSIFRSNGYSVSEIATDIDGFVTRLAMPEDNNKKQEYFFLLEHMAVDDELIDKILNEYTSKFIELLSKSELTDESFRKNCSMILSCVGDKISSRQVLKFEEDPFSFKKNIITYTLEGLSALKEVVTEPPKVSFLNKLISDESGNQFELFKNKLLGDNDYYPLLLRVITKLPIIHYIPPKNELDDLGESIREILTVQQNKLMDFINEIDLNQSEEKLDDVLLGFWGISDE